MDFHNRLRTNRAKHLSRVAAEYTQLLYHVNKAKTDQCAFVDECQWVCEISPSLWHEVYSNLLFPAYRQNTIYTLIRSGPPILKHTQVADKGEGPQTKYRVRESQTYGRYLGVLKDV